MAQCLNPFLRSIDSRYRFRTDIAKLALGRALAKVANHAST
jgi:hypothetical protein